MNYIHFETALHQNIPAISGFVTWDICDPFQDKEHHSGRKNSYDDRETVLYSSWPDKREKSCQKNSPLNYYWNWALLKP